MGLCIWVGRQPPLKWFDKLTMSGKGRLRVMGLRAPHPWMPVYTGMT